MKIWKKGFLTRRTARTKTLRIKVELLMGGTKACDPNVSKWCGNCRRWGDSVGQGP